MEKREGGGALAGTRRGSGWGRGVERTRLSGGVGRAGSVSLPFGGKGSNKRKDLRDPREHVLLPEDSWEFFCGAVAAGKGREGFDSLRNACPVASFSCLLRQIPPYGWFLVPLTAVGRLRRQYVYRSRHGGVAEARKMKYKVQSTESP